MPVHMSMVPSGLVWECMNHRSPRTITTMPAAATMMPAVSVDALTHTNAEQDEVESDCRHDDSGVELHLVPQAT